MKTDAQDVGSLGDMRKQKCGVHMMTLDYVAMHGSMEIADRWNLTTVIMQKCLHKHQHVESKVLAGTTCKLARGF